MNSDDKFIVLARNRQVLAEVKKQFNPDSILATLDFEALERAPSNLLPPEVRIDGIESYAGGGV